MDRSLLLPFHHCQKHAKTTDLIAYGDTVSYSQWFFYFKAPHSTTFSTLDNNVEHEHL